MVLYTVIFYVACLFVHHSHILMHSTSIHENARREIYSTHILWLTNNAVVIEYIP